MEPIGFVVRKDTRSGLDDKEVAQLPDPHPVTWSRRHSQLNTTQVNGGTLNSTRVKSTRWRQKSPLYPNSPPFLLFKTVKIPQPGKNRGSPNFFKLISTTHFPWGGNRLTMKRIKAQDAVFIFLFTSSGCFTQLELDMCCCLKYAICFPNIR